MDRVQLDELTIINFRNISKSSISPGARFNIISGRNGMGKTNIIEAIYLLGALRSFRTTARKDLILHSQEATRIQGVFGQASAGLECEITIKPDSRKILVDKKTAGIDGGHFRKLPMVLFHPGNMDLVQAGPEFRRRFMDRALYQAQLTYPQIHRSYARALASRNRILKSRPSSNLEVAPFDIQLGELGSKIVSMRSDFIDSMSSHFTEAVNEVSGGNVASLEYKPKLVGAKEDFLKVLEERFARDVERGYTTLGPHSDDLEFRVDERMARKFASQGQQRTLVLAAKIAEVRVLAEATGKVPLLLFDDVSSELDRDRNRQLFDFLSSVGGQVFITTTHQDHIPIVEDRLDYFVDNGKVITM